MKQLSFALAVLALSFVSSTPSRADYAVVKFELGYCRIWWDSASNPVGVGWTKIAAGLPTWEAAWSALHSAIAARACL
jgi:hypothetical protein